MKLGDKKCGGHGQTRSIGQKIDGDNRVRFVIIADEGGR